MADLRSSTEPIITIPYSGPIPMANKAHSLTAQVNVAIHITCVPVLLFTGIILACNCPPLFTLPDILQIEYLPANAGTIGALIYATFYVLLEPMAGGLLAPAVIAAAYYGNYFLSTHGSIVNYWAGGIHVVSWLAQFVGHGVFEKRAPALLDNLVQAFLLAPLFVWMEILFFFGYRRELKERFEKGVEQEILKFRKQGNGNGKGKAKAEQ
ncbi:hypothetical protein N7497_004257 [Penicillium chrysogenum]|uniref:Endoplasmic reticulum membrane protein n=1 Tax=Penicillium chrysogenum TaxID=5076 RepID=A0ABQ8WB08_PENCH|nr:hypothetical protein N7505_008660 [Penicillium chrysogenum]KAJ6159720.1 hypothetical protein N7497_004257 [Penicillium chrysogenum]